MAMHAMHADDATGRGCTIDVEHLRLEAGCSERTVQRARAAAREIGVATEVHRGRHLTLEERIEAYDRGSKQRGFASVYALGCPAWLTPKLPHRMQPVSTDPHVAAAVGERGTPPVGTSFGSLSSPRSVLTSAPSAEGLASLESHDSRGGDSNGTEWPPVQAPGSAQTPPRPRPSPAKSRWRQDHARGDQRPRAARRRPSYSPEAIRLATAVRRHVPALRHTPLGRLVPAHTRFACTEQPWSAEELVRTAYGVARAKGWTVQTHRVRIPAAWWAGLLDGIDPVAKPSGHLDVPPQETKLNRLPDGCATFWEAAARAERETATLREQHRERQLEQEAKDARAGRNLCQHGASGADPATSRSPRCALCRYQ